MIGSYQLVFNTVIFFRGKQWKGVVYNMLAILQVAMNLVHFNAVQENHNVLFILQMSIL